MLVKEIVYMVLDLAKAYTSDDSFFNEDHVLFLLKKYRSFLIKKEQEKLNSQIAELEEEITHAALNTEETVDYSRVSIGACVVVDRSGAEKAATRVEDVLELFNEISVECGN